MTHAISVIIMTIVYILSFPSCNETIYTSGEGGDNDSIEGVWIDPETGLMWQNPSVSSYLSLEVDLYCVTLELNGYSDWHLPTIDELRSLISGCPATETGGDCQVSVQHTNSNLLCGGCSDMQGPGQDGCYWASELRGECAWHWSKTLRTGVGGKMVGDVWGIFFNDGRISSFLFQENNNVRCVRR